MAIPGRRHWITGCRVSSIPLSKQLLMLFVALTALIGSNLSAAAARDSSVPSVRREIFSDTRVVAPKICSKSIPDRDINGKKWFELGNYDYALAEFEKNSSGSQKEHGTMIWHARTLAKLHQLPKALSEIDEVLASDKRNEWAYRAKIEILVDASRFNDALIVCEQLRKYGYDFDGIYFQEKYKVYSAMHDDDAARTTAIDGYRHCVRNSLKTEGIEVVLKELNLGLPTVTPGAPTGNAEVLAVLSKLKYQNLPLHERELQILLPGNYRPGLEAWYSDEYPLEVVTQVTALYAPDCEPVSNFRPLGSQLTIDINPDSTFITPEMLESSVGRFTEEFKVEPNSGCRLRYDPGFRRTFANTEQIYCFTTYGTKQLNRVVINWHSGDKTVPDDVLNLEGACVKAKDCVKNHKYSDAIRMLVEDSSLFCVRPDAQFKKQLRDCRAILVECFEGLHNTEVREYLEGVPLEYFRQDLIAYRWRHVFPTITEYRQLQWRLRGDVFTSHKGSGSYEVWLESYPPVTIPRESDAFASLFGQVGYLDELTAVGYLPIKPLAAKYLDEQFGRSDSR